MGRRPYDPAKAVRIRRRSHTAATRLPRTKTVSFPQSAASAKPETVRFQNQPATRNRGIRLRRRAMARQFDPGAQADARFRTANSDARFHKPLCDEDGRLFGAHIATAPRKHRRTLRVLPNHAWANAHADREGQRHPKTVSYRRHELPANEDGPIPKTPPTTPDRGIRL